MSRADLTEKILKDARAEAAEIEKKADSNAERLIARAREDLEKDRERLNKEAERIAGEKYQNIVTLSHIEARNKTLETKQNLITEVFDLVRKRMNELEGVEFKKFALNLLSNFPPEEKTFLVVGSNHTSIIDASFVKELNQKVRDKARGEFVLTETGPKIKNGFYLLTGNIQIDLTFKSILKTIHEEMELEIIQKLFGKV